MQASSVRDTEDSRSDCIGYTYIAVSKMFHRVEANQRTHRKIFIKLEFCVGSTDMVTKRSSRISDTDTGLDLRCTKFELAGRLQSSP